MRDATEFQHKAILALAESGASREYMADLLDISLRSVRRYLNTDCPAYAKEMAERAAREAEFDRLRPTRAVTPFVDEEEEATAMATRSVSRKVRVKARRIGALLKAGQTQAAIARETGIPRQTVSRIAKTVLAA